MTAPPDSALIVDLIAHRVRLLAQRRLNWLSHIVSTDSPIISVVDRDLTHLLNDVDNPHDEARWQVNQPETEELMAIEAQIQADNTSPLASVIRVFALSRQDVDVLHLVLAQAIDPSLGRLFAYLHDDVQRSYVTPYLVARLCRQNRFLQWSDASNLLQWRIVHRHKTDVNPQFHALSIDETIRDWLLGTRHLDPALIDYAQLIPPKPPLPAWRVHPLADQIKTSLEHDPSKTVIVNVIGDALSGKKTFAACVSAELGLPALFIDSSEAVDDSVLFTYAQRHAFLNRVALIWREPPSRWLSSIGHFPIQFVLTNKPKSRVSVPDSVTVSVALTMPDSATRQDLWQQYAPQVADQNPEALATIAHQYRVHVGHIVQAVNHPGLTIDRILQRLSMMQQNVLGMLAHRLDAPYTWNDLIVPDHIQHTLQDFMYEAQERHHIWEHDTFKRLFPQGRGLIALFNGASGTGKTMAAQVIARSLELDLYRVDLSTVISKYIGETAQHLQRIITRAETMNAILFFDEADALFSRRTDVNDSHDRYANTDTNYLLQSLESFSGIAILASNRKDNIDSAFVRRLRYVIEFPRPDASQRYALWCHWLSALTDNETVIHLDNLLEKLAQNQEATGAQIKYAVLTAIFSARRDNRPLSTEHLLHGLSRELMKEGRAFSIREREQLQHTPVNRRNGSAPYG